MTSFPARALVLALLALPRSLHGVEAAPATSSLFRAVDDLSVPDSSRPVKDLVLSAGAATIRLPEGRAAVVTDPDGVPAGLFLSGKGTFTYVSRDPREHPAVRWTLSKNPRLSPAATEAGLAIVDSFETLLWLAPAQTLPELPSPATEPSLGPAFRKHRDRTAKVKEPPSAHLRAAQRRDAPGPRVVRAEPPGGREDLVFLHDPLESGRERIPASGRFQARVSRGDDRSYAILLAEQPIEGDLFDPPSPRAVLTHVDLKVTASGGSDVSISATETFEARRGDVGTLLLDLLDTAETQTGATVQQTALFGNVQRGSDRIRERPVTVTGVFDEAGNALEFDHRNDHLAVALRAPIAAGKSARGRVAAEGGLRVRPLGNNYWLLGLAPWFPAPPMAGRAFSARVTMSVPKPFHPIAPGVTLRRAEEGERNVLETRLDGPAQNLAVLAGAYSLEEEVKDGRTLRVASYGGRNRTASRSLLDLGFATASFFEIFLGKMPVRELTVVEMAVWAQGQAPAGLLLIGTEAFNPMGTGRYRRAAAGVNERFAHELSHQWWGNGVRLPDLSEQWLSESFAEYCSAFFIRQAAGKEAYDLYLTRWRSRAAQTKETVPLLLAHRLRAKNDQVQADNLRTWLLYDRGPLVLAAIHREIGDEAFLTFLSSVQSTLGGRLGTTKRVEEVLEAVTRKDWTPFFDRFVRGTEIPTVP
ncbi:MAG TPA: M1 family aminopeptidase [Thermoanaerobaculia bacterium]|nr:M1 family aminopeptidase [Thermoanaerobaculia bacterium]